jgi:hypothetical protein
MAGRKSEARHQHHPLVERGEEVMADTSTNTKEKKVFLVAWNPDNIVESQGFADPASLALEFCDAVWKASHKTYKYEIVHSETLNDVPELEGNFKYRTPDLLSVLKGQTQPSSLMFDYGKFLHQYEIVARVMSREIDEVWLFGYPFSGFHEAVMGGPRPIYLTGPALFDTDNALRRFPIMGFNYGQDLGGMLEAFIHRIEAIMTIVYEKHPARLNRWQDFIRTDKTNPGHAGVGTAHRAPNSNFDWDFKNPRYVQSSCEDWYNYPNLTGRQTTVNMTEWGFGSRIEHHKWWLRHLPHAVGKVDGIFNNWWHYVMSPDWIGS